MHKIREDLTFGQKGPQTKSLSKDRCRFKRGEKNIYIFLHKMCFNTTKNIFHKK